MGASCSKTQKANKPTENGSPYKLPSNPSINGTGSKAVIPNLQQPQLNSLIIEEKPKSALKQSAHLSDWSKLEGIDKIAEKMTSFDMNSYIRESKQKTLEIVQQLTFKNTAEAAFTVEQIMKKLSEKDITPINKNNNAINQKLKNLTKEIKNNLVDVFHMFIGKLPENPQTSFSINDLFELMAHLIQLFQMMIFYKDLRVKESFFNDEGDEEFLSESEIFIKNSIEKIKAFLNFGVKNEQEEKILKELKKSYLNTLYDSTLMRVFNDSSKTSPRLTKHKMEYYLNNCDVEESFEEENFKKPSETLLITGVKKSNNKSKIYHNR